MRLSRVNCEWGWGMWIKQKPLNMPLGEGVGGNPDINNGYLTDRPITQRRIYNKKSNLLFLSFRSSYIKKTASLVK